MRVLVTGATGWIGSHVVNVLKKRNHEVLIDLDQEPEAVIHLAWSGLPNYNSPIHFGNLKWQVEFLKKVAAKGITNVTITGTCLETLDSFVPYSITKLALRALAFELFPQLKWIRLWYLYGEGQNQNCLLPRLMNAKEYFSVIDGERDFMDVTVAAERIVDAALQMKVTGIMDCCSGIASPVVEFCRMFRPELKYTLDYKMPYYEPQSFHGDTRKMALITI